MLDTHRTKARRNGGQVFTFPYEPDRIQSLKRIVADFYEQGKKKRYAILVNGELVVGTNFDPANFDKYQRYVDDLTEVIEVRLYFGDSPNANRYIFELKDNSLEGVATPPSYHAAAVSTDLGQNVETRIVQALDRQRLETENQQLHRELKATKKKLKKVKSKVNLQGSGLDVKELISQGIQLYGQINAPAASLPQGIAGSEVEIEMEESECDQFYNELKNKYSESQLEAALKTWELFVKHPDLRKEFQEIISSK